MPNERGVGLIEIMVGIVIGMLMVLIIYQVYLVSEGQKRTITAASDAQQNASYGLFLIGQDLASAGQRHLGVDGGIERLRDAAPDSGGDRRGRDRQRSGHDHRALRRLGLAVDADAASEHRVGRRRRPPGAYLVAGPVGFSPNDVIVAVQGANCTLSTINAGGVSVAAGTGIATITHTLTATPGNNTTATYGAGRGVARQPGPGGDRHAASADPVHRRSGDQHAADAEPAARRCWPVTPVVSNVVNLKAQFGLDTDNDGTVDTWQPATGNWSSANLPLQPPRRWQQIRAVRVAIVTRSDQYENDAVTPGPLGMFCSPGPCAVVDDAHRRSAALPLQGAGNHRPVAQRALERAMNPNREHCVGTPASADPPARRQRGVVLFVALLVMVALALAGIALIRSTDTATTVTGNLVLKQAASLAVDRGIERAIHALVGGRAGARPHPARRRPRTSTRAFAAPRAAAWRRAAPCPRFPTCCAARAAVPAPASPPD